MDERRIFLGVHISFRDERAHYYIVRYDEDAVCLTWLGEPPSDDPSEELLMAHHAKFRILPKENALFEDDEHAAPRQRSFMPPKGDAMGRRAKPIPLAEPKDEPLPMDQFLAEESEDA